MCPERIDYEWRLVRARWVCVGELLRAGVPVEPDKRRRTPLHCAAASGGHAQICRLLLDAPAATICLGLIVANSAGRTDRQWRLTALHLAARHGHLQVVQLLMLEGQTANQRSHRHGNSPLHEAAWHGFSRTVELLCGAGSDANAQNVAMATPLHLAVQNGHNQSTRALLYAGSDPNKRNTFGDTALHTAARYGHAGVARILLSAGPVTRVNSRNRNGDSALPTWPALFAVGKSSASLRTVKIFEDSDRKSDFPISGKRQCIQSANQHCASVQPCQAFKFHQHVDHMCLQQFCLRWSLSFTQAELLDLQQVAPVPHRALQAIPSSCTCHLGIHACIEHGYREWHGAEAANGNSVAFNRQSLLYQSQLPPSQHRHHTQLPLPPPPPRLLMYRTRSDESLSMSATTVKTQAEKTPNAIGYAVRLTGEGPQFGTAGDRLSHP
uniref:ANK_REP_REGION domain-containing protein n=1 Tax=Macrostomum lignano TaxID=282301 RepID=A0A1I8F3F4_9PLAT